MLFRRLVASLILAALPLTVVAAASARTDATPTLKGVVGPGYTISLRMNGKAVKSLKTGRYKFVIADKASAHGFTIEQETGGKFEKALTAVPYVGTKTATVTLKKGKWKFDRPPHESMMFGFFVVK